MKDFVNKKAQQLEFGDRFKLQTIAPYKKIHTVLNVENSKIDTTVVYVHCKDKIIYCHKNELVILQ